MDGREGCKRALHEFEEPMGQTAEGSRLCLIHESKAPEKGLNCQLRTIKIHHFPTHPGRMRRARDSGKNESSNT